MTDVGQTKTDTSNYEVLALTANFWAKGPDKNRALNQLRFEAGSGRVKKFGYVLYRVHPDTEVDGIHGDLLSPIGHPPIKIEDKIVRK